MASDGSAPASGVGQMKRKNKVTVAFYFALMIILLNDGVGAKADDAKPNFMHLPLRLRNPRGVGLSHQGARTPNSVHLPEFNPRETEESESVPENHDNTFQDDNTGPRFAHLPQHIHDPRGARVSMSMVEEANVDSVPVNEVKSATPEGNHIRFSHLPRLHNPRGVNVVKQIRTAQEGMSKECGEQAGDEGDQS